MATTTPNYGWTVPTSTDLVKDGATAIETLGDAIDASMNTALGTKKAGMVLLNTTSFTGVASQSFNDVFSTTYNNYRIQFVYEPSTNADRTLTLRMRVGGADASGAEYFNASTGLTTANAASNEASANATSFVLSRNQHYSTVYFATSLDIMSPFLSKTTSFFGQSTGYTSAVMQSLNVNGLLLNGTSYTGFTLLNSSGNINTGVVSIYGYNK